LTGSIADGEKLKLISTYAAGQKAAQDETDQIIKKIVIIIGGSMS
jgi:hypothetical protein